MSASLNGARGFHRKSWLVLAFDFVLITAGFCALLSAATPIIWQSLELSRAEARIQVPVAALSWWGHDEFDGRIVVHLTAAGEISLRGCTLSVDDLGRRLAQAVRSYDVKQRRRGSTGYYDLLPGKFYSRLSLLLRADRDAAWLDVHRVLSCVGRQSLFKVQFASNRVALRGAYWIGTRLDCNLPFDERHSVARIAVHLVQAPERREPRYRLRDDVHDDFGGVERWICDRKRALERDECVALVGLIGADPSVSLQRVVDVLNAFQKCGVDKVDLLCDGRIGPGPIR